MQLKAHYSSIFYYDYDDIITKSLVKQLIKNSIFMTHVNSYENFDS